MKLGLMAATVAAGKRWADGRVVWGVRGRLRIRLLGRREFMVRGFGVLIVVLAVTGSADAQFTFDTGVGYSHLSLDGSDHFRERDGVRIEPRVSINPFENMPELRLGAGLGVSGYSHKLDEDAVITIDNGNDVRTVHSDQWESISILEPEFQVSWRQPMGYDGRWYVEPGVGIGAAVANYGINDNFWWDNEHDSQWDTAFEVRPFVRAGYRTGDSGYGWSFGAEVSYMFGGPIGLTDQVHGTIHELYAGGFFGFTW
jgi:hypothetical protein